MSTRLIPRLIMHNAGRVVIPKPLREQLHLEAGDALEAQPGIFIQTRYCVAPIDGSGTAFQPNLRLSQIETRWAGKINDRLGL